METVHVDELLCFFGNGATKPIHAVISNSRYVLKLFNNPEGNKVLVNELVCYLIAKQLELPIPTAILGIVDGNTKIDPSILSDEDFSDACYGVAFCSELLEPATTISSAKMIGMAKNHKWLLPKLMLFDHLIYNKDRNKGNLLISLSKNNKNLYIIDHSHTFNLEALWNSVGLAQKIEDEDFNDTRIMDDNWYQYSNFKKYVTTDIVEMKDTIDYFKERLSIEFFTSIIEKIPLVWENDRDELISLVNYLIYRMEHLEDFANIIINSKY